MSDLPKGFDKYNYYRRAVQSPETDVEFLSDTYKELRGHRPISLREDFCGTFAISCEWVKLNRKNIVHGVDLDEEPIQYGLQHYHSKLKPTQKQRVHIHNTTVLDRRLPRVDLICAMNFSYYIFKTRKELRAYFANCRRTLKRKGLLIIDSFGGSRCQEANEEKTKRPGFEYFWDQESYNPITNHASFKIHFRPKGGRKIKDVFSYDWRMWTVPELREILEEAGFTRTHVYWEGTTRTGSGNGEWTRTEQGEECEGWIAYIVAE